jgi:hypothetical protein
MRTRIPSRPTWPLLRLSPWPPRKFREFQPSGGFPSSLFRTTLTSGAEVSWPNAAPASGSIDSARVYPEIARFGGDPPAALPEPSRDGQRTIRGEDSRISPPLGGYFTLRGICCRSTVSRRFPRSRCPLVARLTEDAFEAEFRDNLPPLSKRTQQPWILNRQWRSLSNNDQTSAAGEFWASGQRFSEYSATAGWVAPAIQ